MPQMKFSLNKAAAAATIAAAAVSRAGPVHRKYLSTPPAGSARRDSGGIAMAREKFSISAEIINVLAMLVMK